MKNILQQNGRLTRISSNPRNSWKLNRLRIKLGVGTKKTEMRKELATTESRTPLLVASSARIGTHSPPTRTDTIRPSTKTRDLGITITVVTRPRSTLKYGVTPKTQANAGIGVMSPLVSTKVFHAGILMTETERALGTKDSSPQQDTATLVKSGPHKHQIAMDTHPKSTLQKELGITITAGTLPKNTKMSGVTRIHHQNAGTGVMCPLVNLAYSYQLKKPSRLCWRVKRQSAQGMKMFDNFNPIL